MKFQVFKLILGFIKNPKKTWGYCLSINYTIKNTILYFLTPLIIISSIFRLLGLLISLKDFSVSSIILSFLSFTIICFSTIHLSSLVINQLLPKFKETRNFSAIFNLISFSSFPSILASGIADLHPSISAFNFLSLYSIVIFSLGVLKILTIPKEHTLGFILISLIIVTSSIIIISFIIMSISNSIFINLI